MAAGDTRKVLLQNNNGENLIPYTEVASSTTAGRVKPDGTSTTVDANGVISVASSIQSGAAAGATAVQPSGVGDAEIEIQKNGTKVDSFTTNQSGSKQTINITVPTQASDVSALPASTKYGASIDLSLDQTDYKLTFTLKDQDGTTLNSKVVDFPIENVVVGGSYDSTNQKIVLTLQNGTTIDVPVGALISGLQSEITSANKLDADLVDDSTSTNKFVTTSEKSTWSGKQDTATAVTHTASAAVGSGTQPVYIASDGTATATTYSLEKSVPSNAVFTDTTYSAFTGSDGTTAGGSGLVPAPGASDNTKYLKGDGTWDSVSLSVSSDGTTINQNAGGQLQTIGVVNKNTASGAIPQKYDWVGTLAEYTAQAVATNHPEWICYITDDNTNSAYQAYSRSETDALLATKADDNAVVKLTGNQTVGGSKTFTAAPQVINNVADTAISFKNTGLATNNTTPSVDQFRSFRVLANDSSIVGDFRVISNTNGVASATIQARRTINGTNKISSIGCYVNSSGGMYTSAPTPATADNSTKISTTAFVNNKLGATFQVVTALPASPTAGVFYFVKE